MKEREMAPIVVDVRVVAAFKDYAKLYNDDEVMCWLLGPMIAADADPMTTRYITHAFSPKFESSTTEVWGSSPDSETKLLTYCGEKNLQVRGWLHSHPLWDAFLSAIDCHCAIGLQCQDKLFCLFVVVLFFCLFACCFCISLVDALVS